MLRMFYFSGTGNARNVAHWIASAWRGRGRDAEVLDLAEVAAGAVRLDPGDEVGLASPTHGFNFPPITLRFLLSFPRARNANRAFVVNTRAGVRLFGVCLPGLSGAAQLLAALVLLLKGYRVVGMRPIDLLSTKMGLFSVDDLMERLPVCYLGVTPGRYARLPYAAGRTRCGDPSSSTRPDRNRRIAGRGRPSRMLAGDPLVCTRLRWTAVRHQTCAASLPHAAGRGIIPRAGAAAWGRWRWIGAHAGTGGDAWLSTGPKSATAATCRTSKS